MRIQEMKTNKILPHLKSSKEDTGTGTVRDT